MSRVLRKRQNVPIHDTKTDSIHLMKNCAGYYKCDKCGQEFTSKQMKEKHVNITLREKKCPVKNCCASFTHSSGLSRHRKEKHTSVPFKLDPLAKMQKKQQSNLKGKLAKKEQFFEYAASINSDNYLFKNVQKDVHVCQICLRASNVHKCSGKCSGFFHRECVSKDPIINSNDWYDEHMQRMCAEIKDETLLSTSTDLFECATCSGKSQPKCFVCHTANNLVICSKKECGYYFHIECLKLWPQHDVKRIQGTVKSLRCPRHVCHTCISDHPKANYAPNIETDTKLIKCVLCPATYHRKSICIPAGSELVSQTQMICPRHRKTLKKPINSNWCYLCDSNVGCLFCCEKCPNACHQKCLNIPEPKDAYICEECESGRLPLYGEAVWAKHNRCKWWPGVLVDSFNVPENIAKKKVDPNYMAVRFFGTYDFGWVCQGYVYLYDIEDTKFNEFNARNKKYSIAIQEAAEYVKKINEKYGERKSIRHRPQYIKIQNNCTVPPVKLQRNRNHTPNICNCSPNDVDPCGPENVKGCVNYRLAMECDGNCPAKDKCKNQRFSNHLYPKLQLNRFASKGWGIIAMENIKSGAFIIEYVGEVINSTEFKCRFDQAKHDKNMNFYFMNLESGYYIDASMKGNMARFINHSCSPNCQIEKWIVGGKTCIGIFATQNISSNTELTFDYQWDKMIDMQRSECYCGAQNCSGVIGMRKKSPKA